MTDTPDAIVLFSGGLDSILAARLLQSQGLAVRCLHCTSPFFGDAAAVASWQERYGLDIRSLDVSEDFAALLRRRPVYGFGKVMNPCVDCKILLLRQARLYMQAVGGRVLATGEVLGQRPMSQRRDTLHVIMRDAGVSDVLLRPLCAQHLPPVPAEVEGLVDRSRLLGISGRGRSEQLALAAHYGLKTIPTPGGGCRLTERENARRYWPVLTRRAQPEAADFALANLGRQFWRSAPEGEYWLSVGRNSADNQRLAAAARPGDALITLKDLPGPLALARDGATWPPPVLEEAAALTASYAPKAVALAAPVMLRARWRDNGRELAVMPRRPQGHADLWREPAWEEVRSEIRAEMRAALQARETGARSAPRCVKADCGRRL
ncbi:tRNA(5-methylaminomethyl-2-thiouridylate) methyltransferase [Desulfovibrio sp. ZJ200]|uniref:tRNA(5-methylaminomethyl-2-thiouridylate) methyltransferase n=1 Tax=Desulfovibrio sp. ZJ200 TaxID=2709792 RepID=UPI0013EC08F4|nr:tRNA(5-methylaminomethyl-2-thiouridylate) methyltransferase [Desulfovibrio sp. ZJ200]